MPFLVDVAIENIKKKINNFFYLFWVQLYLKIEYNKKILTYKFPPPFLFLRMSWTQEDQNKLNQLLNEVFSEAFRRKVERLCQENQPDEEEWEIISPFDVSSIGCEFGDDETANNPSTGGFFGFFRRVFMV
jgi:hypothetical protein